MIEDHVNYLSGLRTALDHVQSFVYIKNSKSEYVYANIHTLNLFGCTAEDLYLADDSNFFPSDIVQILKAVDLRVLSGESTQEEIVVNDRKLGNRIYLGVKTPVYSDNDPANIIGILGISTDITFQKSLEEKAIKLAKTDALTGLANRLELDSVLSEEIERVKRFQSSLSIIMLDLDHFKKVNDNYGHLLGDKCLIKTAEILKTSSRSVDTVGRWGGEEFLIVCPETDLDGALKLAEKIRHFLEGNIFPEVKQITGSLGVTAFIAGDTLETLISRADKALYKAKEFGRNRVEAFEL
jgi:diguanylate cyclase (GGDEF)-like protein/PAS domain S-box-containing protein